MAVFHPPDSLDQLDTEIQLKTLDCSKHSEAQHFYTQALC